MEKAVNQLAIFVPSLNRPHRLESLITNIREATPELHKIYAMVSDDESANILKDLKVKFWRDDGKDTRYVTRMNYMYRHTREPFMFMGSDDVFFHQGWFSKAMNEMQDASVVIINDLLNPNGTQALIRRQYIDEQSGCMDTPGVLFYPDYGHNYADTEQFATAQHRGVLAKSEASIVEHLHWANGKSTQDETYELSNKTSGQDQKLFLSRQHLWS